MNGGIVVQRKKNNKQREETIMKDEESRKVLKIMNKWKIAAWGCLGVLIVVVETSLYVMKQMEEQIIALKQENEDTYRKWVKERNAK